MNLPTGRRASDGLAPLPPWVGRTILALAISGLLALTTIAWSSKADRQEVDALRFDVQRVLDLLCADRPAARQCQ